MADKTQRVIWNTNCSTELVSHFIPEGVFMIESCGDSDDGFKVEEALGLNPDMVQGYVVVVIDAAPDLMTNIC